MRTQNSGVHMRSHQAIEGLCPTAAGPQILTGCSGHLWPSARDYFITLRLAENLAYEIISPPAPLELFTVGANARMIRLVWALLHGPLWREVADRVGKCSNSPDEIAKIRRLGPGAEHLVCTRYTVIDSDGKPCRPGRYSLTPTGHAMLAEWLNSLMVVR